MLAIVDSRGAPPERTAARNEDPGAFGCILELHLPINTKGFSALKRVTIGTVSNPVNI